MTTAKQANKIVEQIMLSKVSPQSKKSPKILILCLVLVCCRVNNEYCATWLVQIESLWHVSALRVHSAAYVVMSELCQHGK